MTTHQNPIDRLVAHFPGAENLRAAYLEVASLFRADEVQAGVESLLRSYGRSQPPFPERLRRACQAERQEEPEAKPRKAKVPLAYQSHVFEDASWMDGRGPKMRRLANGPLPEMDGCTQCQREGTEPEARWVADRSAGIVHCTLHGVGWRGTLPPEPDVPLVDPAQMRADLDALVARLAAKKSVRRKPPQADEVEF